MSLNPLVVIDTAFRINPAATRIAVGGGVVVMLAIALKEASGDQGTGDISSTLLPLLGTVLVSSIIILLLQNLPAMVLRVGSTAIVLLLVIYLGAIFLQAITGNGIPQFAPAHCIASFGLSKECRITSPAAAGSIPGATAVAVSVPQASSTVAAEISIPRELTVFIQFAGFTRERVVSLAQSLRGDGWNVPAAERGGERLGAAAGLNEIRYFHADDEAVARKLASSVASFLKRPVQVKSLSGTTYSNASPGKHLEVWISE